jgi:DNA repair protein RecN (Recombination protein N)
MLALHTVFENAGEGRVLVFDEVDAGISGAVADAVGSRLADLAETHQVLCVTHLPQVAAHAERHYRVRKETAGGRTRTEIAGLSDEERVEELARMLAGSEPTSASRRNAADLIAAAARGTGGSRRSA